LPDWFGASTEKGTSPVLVQRERRRAASHASLPPRLPDAVKKSLQEPQRRANDGKLRGIAATWTLTLSLTFRSGLAKKFTERNALPHSGAVFDIRTLTAFPMARAGGRPQARAQAAATRKYMFVHAYTNIDRPSTERGRRRARHLGKAGGAQAQPSTERLGHGQNHFGYFCARANSSTPRIDDLDEIEDLEVGFVEGSQSPNSCGFERGRECRV
jgi:hypothetical protein